MDFPWFRGIYAENKPVGFILVNEFGTSFVYTSVVDSTGGSGGFCIALLTPQQGVRLIRERMMSLWVLIPLSFIHIGVGGAVGFGLVFAACVGRGVTMSKFSNDACVALWFAYVISLLLSVFLVIYFYLTDSETPYFWWYAMPWTLLSVLIIYWKASIVKLA